MLLWQGVNEEDAQADILPVGNKRPQQSDINSCAKKQKLDSTAGKPTIYSYDSLLSHILGEKSAATVYVGSISYDVDTDSLTQFFSSHGLVPTSVRIIKISDGHSRGLEQ